jgi:GNAT superfamily N-acetyltransferase
VDQHAGLHQRSGRQEDVGTVARIWWEGWRDGHGGFVPRALEEARTEASFRARAARRIDETTVALVDGTVAGFVIVVGDEVEQVYVAARHRGTDIAGRLIREAERQVEEHGYSRAWLAVVAGNTRARAFYERSGWRDEGPFVYAAATEHGPIEVPCHRYTKQLSTAPEN